MHPKSDVSADAKTIPSSEKSIENEDKNAHPEEKIVIHKNLSTETYYIVRWYGYEPQDSTVRLAAHVLHRFGEAYWKKVGNGHYRRKPTKEKED